MAGKAIRMQYEIIIHTRPLVPTTDLNPDGTFTPVADIGVLQQLGTYNNPPNPGDVIFTSERSACDEAISIIKFQQQKLGGNVRGTIVGKPCGADVPNAARALESAERNALVYAELDTVSAGLYDAVKLANHVPYTGSLTIRSDAGPEAETVAPGETDLGS